MDLLQTIRLVWAQYRAFQRALLELKSYSESELDDLGITRGDIPRFAYEEAEQHAEALVLRRPALKPSAPHQEPEALAA
jgi:uncharacterized protein YjiS (DUF1127 family)